MVVKTVFIVNDEVVECVCMRWAGDDFEETFENLPDDVPVSALMDEIQKRIAWFEEHGPTQCLENWRDIAVLATTYPLATLRCL